MTKYDGQLLPEDLRDFDLSQTNTADAKVMAPIFPFAKHGQSGIEISSLFPLLARHADKLAVIRSCYHELFIHSSALNLMDSGSPLLGHPSVGSWVTDCKNNHQERANCVDRPIAGLLTDLQQRGLLETTLVVWAGEFGRTPIMQANQGRDHHPYGFSIWMAGGGIRGGKRIGATDDFGFKAVEDRFHANDLHATMLTLLGLDHERLEYLFEGRRRRLSDVGGHNELSRRLMA